MLRPTALHSALQALLEDDLSDDVARCETALLALPDSGLLYAAAHRPKSSSADAFPATAEGPTSAHPSAAANAASIGSALMGAGATSSTAAVLSPRHPHLSTDERARALAAVATQAWREEQPHQASSGAFANRSNNNAVAPNGDRGRSRSTTLQGASLSDALPTSSAGEDLTSATSILFHSELGATLVMPLRSTARTTMRIESDPRRAQQESQPVMLLVLNSASYDWHEASSDSLDPQLEAQSEARRSEDDDALNPTPTNGTIGFALDEEAKARDIWKTMLELAQAFEAHVCPSLAQAFAPAHQQPPAAKLA
ncbi:hypothetical protein IE81DRAFT_344836 [Ceraceosorus guamensis]|uniref:Uncharacterized protein n=1 Tax=Ceraceosorus guamensis TaxID=1522189 RepID=A0A316W6P0_9BASI|nr:hypothetical protein IE81DRAFT_344836 [Ceraceosorus guamensis]PWN45537.1 hypothetical protein IE81DRAFT_344836 [Ceraceosorus guamensis]